MKKRLKRVILELSAIREKGGKDIDDHIDRLHADNINIPSDWRVNKTEAYEGASLLLAEMADRTYEAGLAAVGDPLAEEEQVRSESDIVRFDDYWREHGVPKSTAHRWVNIACGLNYDTSGSRLVSRKALEVHLNAWQQGQERKKKKRSR